MRSQFACLVLGVLLVPGAAFADSHNWDMMGGSSWGGGGSTLGGFIVALGKDWNPKEPSKGEPPPRFRHVLIGGVGGTSVQFGSHDDGSASVTQVIWSAGPRVTLEKSHDSRNFYHAQVTFGQVLANDGLLRKNFTTTVGAAWDYVFSAHDGRTPHPGLGMRLQADRVYNKGQDDFWRLAAGVIYRIPKL